LYSQVSNPQQSLYRLFSAARFYSQVSSHSRHYSTSSVQLCCTAKFHPTAVTIPQVQCSSVVQTSLIPQQSLYRKFSVAMMYSQVSSHSSQYTTSSVQLRCTTKFHPPEDNILQVQCSSVVQPRLIPQQSLYCRVQFISVVQTGFIQQQSLYRKLSAVMFYSQEFSHSIHYTASSVQLCYTAKTHPTAVTILPVQCSSVVQPSFIPQQSLYSKFSAALLYSQDSSHSSRYTASSVLLCCTAKSHPTAVTIPQVQVRSFVQPRLISEQ